MRPGPVNLPEEDLEAQIRAAFTADDPEAAWYFDRVAERVVRVCRGETSIPDLAAADVEEDEERYAEIPAVTESEVHGWMEEFAEGHADPRVAALLDERHGANGRFRKRLAGNPDWARDWQAFEAGRVDELVRAWRAGLGG